MRGFRIRGRSGGQHQLEGLGVEVGAKKHWRVAEPGLRLLGSGPLSVSNKCLAQTNDAWTVADALSFVSKCETMRRVWTESTRMQQETCRSALPIQATRRRSRLAWQQR